MADQNGVAFVFVQCAIVLIGNLERRQNNAAIKL